MYEEWFGKFTSDDDNPKPEEVQALKDFLDGATSAQVAAAKFTAMVPDEEGSADGLYRIWNLVCDAAREIPRSQEKLVELLAAIRQLPDVKCKRSEYFGPMDSINWRDLPILGWMLRDLWNCRSHSLLSTFKQPPPNATPIHSITPIPIFAHSAADAHPPASDDDRDKVRQQWVNVNAFAAKLTAADVTVSKLFAIWGFREALEDECWDPPFNPAASDEVCRVAKLYGSTIGILDGLVPAAAQWIFHAGPLVFQCQEEYPPGARGGDPAGGGNLWKGKHGFCRERWQLWKSRFQWVAEKQSLREGTRAVAKEAVDVMETIERDV